jgi:hypothetical protein
MNDQASAGASDGPTEDLESELFRELKTLNARLWEGRVPRPQIERWLANFAPDEAESTDPSERLHALYLLSRFLYFGAQEMRSMLRALYREHVRYPIIADVRRQLGDTTDAALLNAIFQMALMRTRFIGLGNPSESGAHLLYPFRQMNGIPKELFISAYEILDRPPNSPARLRYPDVSRYIFVDDFCGTGHQAEEFAKDLVAEIKAVAAIEGVTTSISYFVLVATTAGLKAVNDHANFDSVRCVVELDETFRCFGTSSRYFTPLSPRIDPVFARDMSYLYGKSLWGHPLGYADSQLLVGFHHNTPDNTLPIIWYDEPDKVWQPVFPRYHKVSLQP